MVGLNLQHGLYGVGWIMNLKIGMMILYYIVMMMKIKLQKN